VIAALRAALRDERLPPGRIRDAELAAARHLAAALGLARRLGPDPRVKLPSARTFCPTPTRWFLPSLARLMVFVDRVLVARACSPKYSINHYKTLLNIGAFQRQDSQAIMELP
jgi:hypothetical protein